MKMPLPKYTVTTKIHSVRIVYISHEQEGCFFKNINALMLVI